MLATRQQRTSEKQNGTSTSKTTNHPHPLLLQKHLPKLPLSILLATMPPKPKQRLPGIPTLEEGDVNRVFLFVPRTQTTVHHNNKKLVLWPPRWAARFGHRNLLTHASIVIFKGCNEKLYLPPLLKQKHLPPLPNPKPKHRSLPLHPPPPPLPLQGTQLLTNIHRL